MSQQEQQMDQQQMEQQFLDEQDQEHEHEEQLNQSQMDNNLNATQPLDTSLQIQPEDIDAALAANHASNAANSSDDLNTTQDDLSAAASSSSSSSSTHNLSNMSSPVMDNIISVATRVVQACQTNYQLHVPQLLATYVVRTMALVDTTRFDLMAPLSPSDVLELTKLAVARLVVTDSPSLACITLQVTFHSTYSTYERKVYQHKIKKEEENEMALQNIIELSNKLKTEQSITALYRAIFQFLLANGCIDNNNRSVEREVAAALESVFPKVGLKGFCALPVEDRRKQLKDLVHIVLGIRVFNRAVNKGGAGLVDPFQVVGDEVTELCHKLRDEIQAVYDETLRYTEVINFEFKHPGSISAPWQRLQEELSHRRQLMTYLRQLQAESLDVAHMISQTKTTFDDQMSGFKKLVGERSSVPKEEVYPRFQLFARLWMAVSEEREKNRVRQSVWRELHKALESFHPSLNQNDLVQAINTAAQEASDPVEHEAMVALPIIPLSDGSDSHMSGLPDHPSFASVARITAQSAPDLFMQLPMEYQGFCAWTVVHRAGLLLPGNPNVGLLRYKGRYYSFVNARAMLNFFEDPEKYVVGVMQEGQRHPELIHLLRIQDSFPYSAISSFIEGYGHRPEFKSMFDDAPNVRVDAGTDTPTHFIEKHIDPTYDWNEWSLRKKAIQLANLRNKSTHSTQTHLSHFKREAETQVALPKVLPDGSMAGVSTQTGITKGTNTTIIRQHTTHLRGQYDSKPHVVSVNLTQVSEDIAEPKPAFLKPANAPRSRIQVQKVSTGV